MVSEAHSGGTGSSGQPDNGHCGTAAIAVPGARLPLISPVPKVPVSRPCSTASLSPEPLSANLQLHMCHGCAWEEPGAVNRPGASQG